MQSLGLSNVHSWAACRRPIPLQVAYGEVDVLRKLLRPTGLYCLVLSGHVLGPSSARKLGARARHFSPSAQFKDTWANVGPSAVRKSQNPTGFGPDGRNPLHLAARRGQAGTEDVSRGQFVEFPCVS